MSDNIPFEIQVEIMKRLPVKSLMQFRSVSKTWKSLIDSPDFIKHYSGQLQHLLVSHKDLYGFRKFVSIADDCSFPQKKLSLTFPMSLNIFDNPSLIGSSHGLLCLYDAYTDGGCDDFIVLWNLSIRKAVAIVRPEVEYDVFCIVIGFGVCRETTDPKIVKMTQNGMGSRYRYPWEVEVFALSTGAWRSLHNNLLRESISFSYDCYDQVVIDGIHYWLATDVITLNGGCRCCNLIIAFDLRSEEFSEINLPANLANTARYKFMTKLRESLAVLECDKDEMLYVVWMLEDGVSKAFTKLYTVNYNTPDALGFVWGFRKTGEAIIEDRHGQLVVYEPYSKHVYNLVIDGKHYDFFVHSYMETLLLHDQPNLKVYNETKTLKVQDDLVS